MPEIKPRDKSVQGVITVFRESINETPAHKEYLKPSTTSYFPLPIYSVIFHVQWSVLL